MNRSAYSVAAIVLYSIGQAVVCMAADEPKTADKPDTLLYVRTTPPGAKVLLDGKELGVSDGMFPVGPGKAKVRVELEGYAASEKEVNIQINEIARVEIALAPLAEPNADASEATEEDVVIEGVGWRDFKVGATLDELTKAYGPPDENTDPQQRRPHWRSMHVDCFIPSPGGGAVEVQFGGGFKYALKSGIRIGSSEKDVLNAYGAPDFVRNQANAKMVEFRKQGVLMWLGKGKVTSFTVGSPREVKESQTFETQPASNPAQLAQQGWQLWSKGQFVEAAEKFEAAVAAAPKDQNAWNGLGWARFNSGKRPEAKEAFERAVALNAKHPGALNGLGQLYLAEKKYDLAEKYLLKAAPKASAAWYGLARIYLLQGKFEKAEKYAQMCVDSGQSDKTAESMLKAAKEKRLGDGLRIMIEPQSDDSQPADDDEQAEAEKKAIESAESWLALVDKKQYEASWDAAAELLRNTEGKADFAKAVEAARRPLGDLKSRELNSQQYVTRLLGAPDGQYVILKYRTVFADKESAVETITPMLDKDGNWKVLVYYIK